MLPTAVVTAQVAVLLPLFRLCHHAGSFPTLSPTSFLRAMLATLLLLGYFCAALWLMASLRTAVGALSAHSKRLIGLSVASLSWLLHGYSLCEWIFRSGNLVLTIESAGSLISWFCVAIAVIKTIQNPRFAAITAGMLTLTGIAAALGHLSQPAYEVADTNISLIVHVTLSVLAYALLTIAAAMALALTLLDRRLHQHRSLGMLAQLPSVDALETGMFQAITVGFALLTLTLISGFIFVDNLFAQHLAHKVILSSIAWAVLAVLLTGRHFFGWRGRTAARWALASFVLLWLAYFGSKFVLESVLGRHWT